MHQAFAVIASSSLRIDLSCVLEHVFAELTTFLQKVSFTFALQPCLAFEHCFNTSHWA